MIKDTFSLWCMWIMLKVLSLFCLCFCFLNTSSSFFFFLQFWQLLLIHAFHCLMLLCFMCFFCNTVLIRHQLYFRYVQVSESEHCTISIFWALFYSKSCYYCMMSAIFFPCHLTDLWAGWNRKQSILDNESLSGRIKRFSRETSRLFWMPGDCHCTQVLLDSTRHGAGFVM